MELKTIDIKGKEYVTVNERIKAFWSLYPNGRINTELISNVIDVCVIKAEVYKDNRQNALPDATGYAYEKESSSFINKTSYIENCETSAVGRALGILGIGIDTSIASADEVNNAIYLQTTTIDSTKVDALNRAIEKCNLDNKRVQSILKKFNYERVEDIKQCDYITIVNELKAIKEA